MDGENLDGRKTHCIRTHLLIAQQNFLLVNWLEDRPKSNKSHLGGGKAIFAVSQEQGTQVYPKN